jgi:chloramphenicol O-acetyltransferase
MKTVDLATWNRRRHFELFRSYAQPFFNVCFELDVTRFLLRNKAAGRPFFLAFLHAVMTSVNATEAFRLRLRGDEVVLHDTVHASFTMMTDQQVFRFVTVPHDPDADAFIAAAARISDAGRSDVTVADVLGVDDLVFVSSMPWMTFTSVQHAMPGNKDDSFPRLTWGKYHETGATIVIPFSVAAHHALVDGADVAAFAATLQRRLDE